MPRLALPLTLAALLGACASTPPDTAAFHAQEARRWERQFKTCAVAYTERFDAALPPATRAQQAVSACSAVLSAYQLRQRDFYLSSQPGQPADLAWAHAEADGRRLEFAIMQLLLQRQTPG